MNRTRIPSVSRIIETPGVPLVKNKYNKVLKGGVTLVKNKYIRCFEGGVPLENR